MGQQQLLLIILGVIIVGIAIAVGLSMFTAQSVGANKDGIISDITNLSANAYQHRIRPASMGGGGGVYDASLGGTLWTIPAVLDTTENGFYSATVTDNLITFVGISVQGYGTVTGAYDGTGRLVPPFVFTLQFE